MYENLPLVCYKCGRIGHTNDACRFLEGDPSSENSDCSLLADNFIIVEGDIELEGPIPIVAEEKMGVWGGLPRLGSWLVTSHIQ